MDLAEVLALIDGQLISRNVDLTTKVSLGGGADLASDVLALAQADMLLMTGLTHPQIVTAARLAGCVAIVFVRGKLPPPETVALAEEKGIPLLASKYTMFETCGRLYRAGLPANSLFEAILRQWHEDLDRRKEGA